MFLLDRSGSMTGKPLQYARQALDRALTDLGPSDKLNIIAYDHEQVPMWSTPGPAQPTCVQRRLDLIMACKQGFPAGLTESLIVCCTAWRGPICGQSQ